MVRYLLRVTALSLAACLVTAIASAKQLAVPFVSQMTPVAHTNWCWAASSFAVLGYTGTGPGQLCDVAEWARGANGWPAANCCAASDWTGDVCNQINYMYGSGGSIENILSHWGVASKVAASSLSEAKTKEYIDDDSPTVIRWGWSGGGGHFVVIYGYSGSVLNIMNPGRTDGPVTMSYSTEVS
jgi:hypothetical protein